MQCMWLLSVWTLRRVTSRSLKGRKRKRRRGRQGEKREEAEGGCGLQSCAVYSALCSALCQKSEFHLYTNRLSFRKKCSDHCQRSMVPVHITPIASHSQWFKDGPGPHHPLSLHIVSDSRKEGLNTSTCSDFSASVLSTCSSTSSSYTR